MHYIFGDYYEGWFKSQTSNNNIWRENLHMNIKNGGIRMNLKKVICLVCALLMLTTVLAGCGGGE
jgi:hypothetical protein